MPKPIGLNSLIAKNFSLEELTNLCSDLEVDYENLSGSNKPGKARELMGYVKRNGQRTDDLLYMISQYHPNLDLQPYLYLLIIEHFGTADGMKSLCESLRGDCRAILVDDLGIYDYTPITNYVTEQAVILQDKMKEEERLGDLVLALRDAKPRLNLRIFERLITQAGSTSEPKLTNVQEANNQTSDNVQETTPTQTDKPSNQSAYVNFDIRIGEKRKEDGRYPVTARSDQGYGETDSSTWQALPDDEEFEEAIDFLRERIGRPSDAETLGQMLRQFLFPPKVLDLYNLSRARIKAENKEGLRVRLRIDRNAPELSKIPWEYCFDDKGFLALNNDTPLVRYIETTEIPKPITAPEKVRILIVTAGPSDQPPLEAADEEKWINSALTGLVQAGRVETRMLHHATRRGLRREIQKYDPHILHFIGHGELLKSGEGALVLENNAGKTSHVSAKDLHMLLRNNDVKLVVLNACQTAAHGTGEAIMGIAPRLLWAGVPAAIAMQFKIPDKMAVGFTRDLYEYLADGTPLDTAVTEARLGAYFDNDDKIFWAIPVLFMRAPDGVIWQ